MPAITRDVTKYGDEHQEFDSLDGFLAADCESSGLYSVRHQENVYTDALFWNQNSDATIVCFNGAGFPSNNIRPGFNGTSMFRSWRQQNRANFLFVHDATLYLDSSLSLAWYGGSRDFSYQTQLESIIRHFIESNETNHLIFFGVSGGGHAALYYASLFPGSIAVAGNPQTNVDKYLDWAKNKYYQACWSKPGTPGEVDTSGFAHDVVSLYAGAPRNFAYCLVNANDDHHVSEHLAPLIEAAHNGLNVRTLLRHWGIGHTACPPGFFLKFFDELVERRRAGEIFPDVCGARLLESAEDVAAVIRSQQPPLQMPLFEGDLTTSHPLRIALTSTVNQTVDLTASALTESAETLRVMVDFILEEPPGGQPVFGLRTVPEGYQGTLLLRLGKPSTLRTYLPADIWVAAIVLTPLENESIRLTDINVTAYSYQEKAK